VLILFVCPPGAVMVELTLRREGMVRTAPVTHVGLSVCLSGPTERISVKLHIEDCMKICRNILVLVKISAKISRPFHEGLNSFFYYWRR
jgi:hypothetical protein